MKYTVLSLIILGLLTSCGPNTPTPSSSWTAFPVPPITTNQGESSINDLSSVTDKNSNLFIAVERRVLASRSVSVQIHRWDGAAWSTTLSTPPLGEEIEPDPKLIIDSVGNPVAIWREIDNAATAKLVAKRWNGQSWADVSGRLDLHENGLSRFGRFILSGNGGQAPLVAFNSPLGTQLRVLSLNEASWEQIGATINHPATLVPNGIIQTNQGLQLGVDARDFSQNPPTYYVSTYSLENNIWTASTPRVEAKVPSSFLYRDRRQQEYVIVQEMLENYINVYVKSNGSWEKIGDKLRDASNSTLSGVAVSEDAQGNILLSWNEFPTNSGGAPPSRIVVYSYTNGAWNRIGTLASTPELNTPMLNPTTLFLLNQKIVVGYSDRLGKIVLEQYNP